MSIPRRAYADGPYGQIHYQHVGDGRAVVLLHQAPMTSGQFDNVYGPLSAHGFLVIGIDMPGFGMSDATESAPTIEDYARAVMPVLDALKLKSAALLGHHTGALVATEAALRWPNRVPALIVNGPLPITDDERKSYMETGHKRELAFAPLGGGEHMTWLFKLREQFAAGTVGPARISDYVVQALIGRGRFWYGHHAAYQYDHAEALARVTQPTLILTNTGDMIYPLALRAREIRPDFEFAELQGGGVDIVDQQPEEWSSIVAEFLQRRLA